MDKTKFLHEFIQEFWYLIKDHIDIPDNSDEAAWFKIIDDSNKVYEKYKGDHAEGKFCKAMVMAWLDYLNERCKGGLEC